jgi:hypothetical protein
VIRGEVSLLCILVLSVGPNIALRRPKMTLGLKGRWCVVCVESIDRWKSKITIAAVCK